MPKPPIASAAGRAVTHLTRRLRLAGLGCVLGVLGAAMACGSALAEDLTITTGGKGKTYYHFGTDIARVAAELGVDIAVAESQGSISNLKRVLGFEGLATDPGNGNRFFQLGFVQADVLDAMRVHARGDATLEGIVDKIRVVLPLYGEEVHVLVPQNSPFSDLRDLLNNADQIAAGKQDSGTRQTVLSLIRVLNLDTDLDRLRPEGGKGAIIALEGDAVDGSIEVGGAPMDIVADALRNTGSVRLLPADLPELYNLENSPYKAAEITAQVYPGIDEPINSTSVLALLIAYDYDEGNPNCALIERTTRAILENIERLQQRGHPKWKEFNLRAAQQRTDIQACAKRALLDF